MSALTPAQRREARRLQQAGMTLGEIAARIGADRAAVTLLLYGGMAEWTAPVSRGAAAVKGEAAARAEGPLTAAAPRKPCEEAVSGRVPLTALPSENLERSERTPTDAPSSEAATRKDAETAAPGPALSRAGRRDPRANVRASGRYVLVNDLGEWLHQSGHGRTRERRWRWEGTGAQLEAIRQRFPHLRELTPEEALS